MRYRITISTPEEYALANTQADYSPKETTAFTFRADSDSEARRIMKREVSRHPSWFKPALVEA